jgi:circadian clock protein KaiB
MFKFRLFVAGEAGNSAQAIANLSAICSTHLPDRHSIEIVDLFLQPERALEEGVFMTPTLVRLSPGPELRIVGTLGQTEVVLQMLGIRELAA